MYSKSVISILPDLKVQRYNKPRGEQNKPFIFYTEAPCIPKLQGRLNLVQGDRNAKSQRVKAGKILMFSLLKKAGFAEMMFLFAVAKKINYICALMLVL
jgi:hypothetical protein